MLYKKSSKELIITNLAVAINAISGIKYVDYQRIYDQSVTADKCPGVFINDIRIDKEKILKDITKNTWLVGLVGFVWAEDAENVGTVMNVFMEKVKDATITDRSRDGNAYTTDITTIETDGGNRHPQGVFVVACEIIFFSAE